MKILLILNHSPYDGSDIIWNALRLSDTVLSNGNDVRIFLMNDSVDLARAQAKLDYEFDLGKMLLDLQNKKAMVKLCTTCINRCGIAKGEILDKSWPGSMQDLASWVCESDKVITF